MSFTDRGSLNDNIINIHLIKMSPLVEMQGTPFKIYSNWSNSVIALMCRIYSKLIKTTVFLNPLEKSF